MKEKISLAWKNGIVFAIYALIVGTIFAAYPAIYPPFTSYIPVVFGPSGITPVVIFLLAVLGLVYGWVLYGISRWLGKELKFGDLKVMAGVVDAVIIGVKWFILGTALSLEVIYIVAGFVMGYGVLWIAEKIHMR
jgi:hypothetical protein